MKSYTTEWIRNVGIVGHGDTGKTQLVSSLLFTAGMTPRLGKVSDGSTVTDWDEEEVARKISINTGLAYAEWQAAGQAEKTKINFLDTPGYSTFINETKSSLIAADASLIVVDAAAGVQVVTEKTWDYATEYDQPRAFVLNWMDRELASFERALDSLQHVFGRGVVPIELPIGSEKNFRGVIDLIAMKALMYTPDGDGKAKIEEIPADLAEEAKTAHEALVELVAEGDDALMQEFFDEGTLPIDDLKKGLREAVLAKRIFPVLLSSALHNIGADAILNFLCDIFPAPCTRGKASGHKTPDHKGETVERKVADSEPLSIFVFKTLADPFAGRITYFKVLSGVLKNDATLTNFNRGTQERLQHVQVMQGKTAVAVNDLHAGDVGAIAKLKETTTGETLGDKSATIFYPPARIPEPSITFAVEPKTRADEDRIGVAIHRILEEDLALRFGRDPQTKEFLLSGAGQQHIEVVVAKLRKRYHVDLTLHPPKVPYRETIRAKADAEGKHKKQTGGHGQFGLCRVKMEPLPRGKGSRICGRFIRRRDPQELDSVRRARYTRIGRARLSRRISGHGFPRHPLRRQISRRGLERYGLPHRRLARLQRSDETGPPRSARTGNARRDLRARSILRRFNGQPEQPPRKNQRQRKPRGKRRDQSAGSALRNAQLRKRIDLDDAGTRQLLDGIFPLRLRPR